MKKEACAQCQQSFPVQQLEYTEAGLSCTTCRLEHVEAQTPLVRVPSTERLLGAAGVAMVLAQSITMRSASSVSAFGTTTVSYGPNLPGLIFSAASVALVAGAILVLMKDKGQLEDDAMKKKAMRSKLLYLVIALLLVASSSYKFWASLPRTIVG